MHPNPSTSGPRSLDLTRLSSKAKTQMASGQGVKKSSQEVKKSRFNKIVIQGKDPDGKWTRKSLVYRESNIFHLCVTRPPEICVNFVFKHIPAASIDTICR